jgi:ribonuclease HI
MKPFRIYTDGGARGNPGPAGIGGVIQEYNEAEGIYQTIKSVKGYLGETTNNQAEYRALLATLIAASEQGVEEVDCFLDSELIVKQLKQEYKVKNQNLAPVFLKVWNLAQTFKKISFTHVPRAQNKEADSLVNEAIDEALKKRV